MGQPSQANLLDQAAFKAYSTSWVDIINTGDPLVLEPLFQQTSRLLAATLPVDQLLQLVSAVGVRRIKIGFVVQPTAPQGESAFTLALYAADSDNRRLSAYYLASTPWATPASTGTPPAAGPGGGLVVPPNLAGLWRQQWTAATGIDADFYRVPDGVLQGYEFSLEDFLQILLAAPQLDDKTLRLDFGLHALYGPDAPTAPGLTRTFGLAAYLVDGHNSIASPMTDLSMPHPPAVSCTA